MMDLHTAMCILYKYISCYFSLHCIILHCCALYVLQYVSYVSLLFLHSPGTWNPQFHFKNYTLYNSLYVTNKELELEPELEFELIGIIDWSLKLNRFNQNLNNFKKNTQ